MATAAPAQLSPGNLIGRMPANRDPGVDPTTGVPQFQPIPQYAPQPVAQPQAPGGLDPSLTAYLDQFNTSLAGSRKAIDTQLAQAMGELGQRRDAAAKVVAGLPGEISQAYAPAAAGLTQAGTAGQGALSQDVRSQVGAMAGPLQSALAMEKGGGNAMQPYLNLANQANYGAGAGALRQQAMIGQQNIDAQQREFVQSLLQNQLQRSQANDDFYAHSQFTHDLNAKDEATHREEQLADAASGHSQAVTDAADQRAIADTGGQIRTAAELDSIRSSPAYKYAVSSMNQPGFLQGIDANDKDTLDMANFAGINTTPLTGAQIAAKYASNPKLLYALLADSRISASDISKAGIQLPSAAPSK